MTLALSASRLLALAGFLDATYLTISHYSGGAVACGPTGGCDVVLSSRWATLGGFPIAATGVLYYAVASLLAWTPSRAWTRATAWSFALLTGAALGVSAFLFYLQLDVIGAWCRFCLVSAVITTLLFLCALALLRAQIGPVAAPEQDARR